MVKSPQLGFKSIFHLIDLCSLMTVLFHAYFLDATLLLRLAPGWSQLQESRLPNNQLIGDAISALTYAKWPFLHNLDLSNNPLGIAGLQHLCPVTASP